MNTAWTYYLGNGTHFSQGENQHSVDYLKGGGMNEL